MTIVTKNSLTVSNVNDGTITHTAYANKSKDIFYDSLPSFANVPGYQEAVVSSVPENGAYKITTTGGTHAQKTYVSINGTSGKALWSIVRLKNTHPANNLRLNFNGIGDGTVPNGGFPTIIIKPGEDYYFMKPGVARSNYDFIQIAFWSDTVDKDLAFTIYEASFYNTAPFIDFSFVPNNHDYLGNYTDALVSASTDITKYNWSFIRGNTSYTHTAYAYSADGADRFTTVYPNLNLLSNTTFKNYTPKTQQYFSMVIKDGGVNNEPYISASYDNPTVNSWTDIISWGFYKEYFKPSTTYTFSFYLKGNGIIRTHVYPTLIDTSSPNGLADGKVITPAGDGMYDWTLTNEWVRHTYTFITRSSITSNQSFLFRIYTGNSVDICLPKVEEGSIATPWMPSDSEVTTADYPSYIGQYTDFTQADSTTPSDYTFSLMRGEDGKISYTHTAYAYSSDGTDRFTTVYPNLNLLTNSRLQSGNITPFSPVNNAVLTINSNVKGLNVSCSGGAISYQQGVGQGVMPVSAGNQYTISVKVINTGTVVIDKFSLQFGFYNSAGTSLGFLNKTLSIPADGKVYSLSFTVTAPDNTTGMRYFCIDTAISANVAHTFTIYDMKAEPGSIVTPYMPSSSEVKTSDYPSYIGTYSDTNVNGSTDPSKYTWAVFKGADGIAGQPGANAPTITNVQDQIYLSTSNTAQSGGSWGILIPAWSSGKYYWSRVATTFDNGATTYSTPVLDEALNQAATNQIKVTQLTQDLDGFKTTVSNTYLSKSDASGTYADKVSVASQINQSATAVTSNVQTWTNNKLTAYSTTQQTATSITNAVANKADKSQITQLSDSINLKVSKGDVISSINQEAGQIVFNANKLVLNANTTEITGDAFIRGDMIVDGTIKAKQLDVEKISSISSDIGEINAGSFITWDVLDKNPSSDMYTLTATYINNGIQKTMSILSNIEIDKDTPISAEVVKSITINDISSGRILLSSANDNGINSELPSHIIGITPDELLKNSYLYTDAVIESGSSVYSGQRYTNLYLEGDNIVLKPIHDPDTEGFIGVLPWLNINHEVSISRNLEVSNHISANGRSLSQRASVSKAIHYGIVWNFRRIGDIVYVDVNRQGVTIGKAVEENLATEGVPIGFRPAYNHSFSLSTNVGSGVGADVVINMLSDNSGYMRITNTTTNFKIVQGSTSYITNDPFPS